ncbi:DNA translocase FtsK [Streptococcus cuniculipharyngis]|uniref:DNA translocase FtsK n=1 Tax=Streptococcus cuniculipharyngis TaxID=1562651 RepID=A0A5C5SE49_9STRE|nr:DNA translocase FtsK [Streptococcus cuniculipharyngis]TWS99256.1 DNA translocase FtsK [Streptococcus cuniculipharyngis]
MGKAKTSRKGRTRRPSKAELERQAAIRRMLVACLVFFLFFFAMLQLGRFGVTAYNFMRFLVGSLAYPVMIGILIYLFGIKWLSKVEGLLSGALLLLMGLLLEWQAYLFVQPHMADKPVVSGTLSLIVEDLLAFSSRQFAGGGLLGALIYKPTAFLFSNIGAFLIGGLFIILGIFLISSWDVLDVIAYGKSLWSTWCNKHQARRQANFLKKEERRLAQEAARQQATSLSYPVDLETGEILDDSETLPTEPEIIAYESEEYWEEADNHEIWYDESEEDHQELIFDVQSPAPLMYRLPSLDLFAPDKPKNQNREKKLVRDNIKVLEETFASFGIKVVVERAEIGPSVTKYEVKPAVGVRVNRIANLADDLALALAAKDVRIEAPIPGKSLVGIEVPNSEIATVSFRELWEQSKTDPNKLLEVPLGKAVNGTARSFDLARMPHLLVAGSTGSGKSVAVNGIISSILMKARPDQVKFMMIDPKMVELSVYNDIPHLLIPVVTNPRKASKALQKIVDEMEHRYELFSQVGVRNLEGYNSKVDEFNSQSAEKQIPLPLLVVIVDELADLMMVASKEVEDAIIRLGQKARAAGIHMILATQRPSVDVISGLIKANVPSRVAFAVSSGTDSRTILDENGAEKLLGRGDMLFKPIDENHPVRLQGSFISDDDVERIVSFIKSQAQADYDENFDPGEVTEADMASGNGGAGAGDPLFEEAKQLVIETQKASASMIQRRLSVGFNRATRLMEELEEAGIIGPAEGTKPRKVLQSQ